MDDYESRLARDREAGYEDREKSLTAEVARLREALESVAKACICGGKGRRMHWPEFRLCEDSGEDHACPEQREIDCFSRQCGIARAALGRTTT